MTEQKYSMPALTAQEREDLITDCLSVVEVHQGSLFADLAQIALASLTAEKKTVRPFGLPQVVGEGCWVECENDDDEVMQFYTAPAVPVLKPIQEPKYRNSPDMHTKQYYEAIGFNQGLDAFVENIRAAGYEVKE